jgi:hypothetical protein
MAERKKNAHSRSFRSEAQATDSTCSGCSPKKAAIKKAAGTEAPSCKNKKKDKRIQPVYQRLFIR